MDNTQLKESIVKLGYVASDELIAKVQALHLQRVPESTINKAFRELKKDEKAAAKAAAAAASAPAA
jgi:hypothetical protein